MWFDTNTFWHCCKIFLYFLCLHRWKSSALASFQSLIYLYEISMCFLRRVPSQAVQSEPSAFEFSYPTTHGDGIRMSGGHIFCQLFPFSSDHCGSGGDAEEGARAGGGAQEAGSDPTAAVQVPAQRAEGRRGLIGRGSTYTWRTDGGPRRGMWSSARRQIGCFTLI